MNAMLFLLLATTLAAPQPLFDRYEAVRQALLSGDVRSVQATARALGAAARSAKLDSLAGHSSQLGNAANIKEARTAFAAVSDDLIRYRNAQGSKQPVVLYCSMEKKSWLQPSAKPVTNPYLDANMRSCGAVTDK